MLRGRGDEITALTGLLGRVREGHSAVLVLRGEAGIGKSALLEFLAEQATGCGVARAVGVEAEMEFAFAGLHHLCAPLLERIETLPAPQREALAVAFGLREGGAPDRFLVALAALSLLADAAEARPLVCLIEDAQWLDRASAQTLSFVARRLLAEPIAMVFAVREPSAADELTGLPQLLVGGLPDDEARRLLASALPGRLDEHVRDQIVAETRGNPLALLELPRGLTPAELAGGFGLTDARPLANRVEENFVQRVRKLPRETRRLLLLAAAEPIGDVSLLWRAAERLGISGCAGSPAEEAALIEFGIRVRFRHPLVRSAAYRAAQPADRQEVHRALADATDPDADPDRRAWHLAQAVSEPDEAVAAELERSAARAQHRGGVAARAAFLERAAELTPDPARRGARALAAAQGKLDVADPVAAEALVSAARLSPLDDREYAQAERLGAQIVFARRRGRDAPPLLLEAARRLDRLDPAMARETYLEAIASAMFAGRLSTGPDERQIAEAARESPRASSPTATEALLDALITRFTDGYAAGVNPLAQSLRSFAGPDSGQDRRWLWLACRMAQDLWDDELWFELATLGVHVARETGALTLLPVMANFLAVFNVHRGAFTTAAALVDEVAAITQATGIPPLNYGALMLAAWRDDEGRMQAIADQGLPGAMTRGEGSAFGGYGWFTALVHNGRGRYRDALDAATRACEHEDVIYYGWALVELIEAGVRSNQPTEAAVALKHLSERTQASGTEWALGIEARCRALVSDDERLYVESIDRLASSRAAVELARSRLLYGEWLRREHRRVDARDQLRTAYETFSRIGANAFAQRARGELLATGEKVRKRADPTRDVLTPQEAQIAQLARDRQTNSEIAAQLFLSPRTVEYHLHKVFTKLSISSRKQLRAALRAQEQPVLTV